MAGWGVQRRPSQCLCAQAVEEGRFSEASDVWAFGVTCHEVFTLGAVPYHGWLNTFVVEKLKGGYRLPRPSRCHPFFFSQVIAPCFAALPEARPTFAELEQRIVHLDNRQAMVRTHSDDDAQVRLPIGLTAGFRIGPVEQRAAPMSAIVRLKAPALDRLCDHCRVRSGI